MNYVKKHRYCVKKWSDVGNVDIICKQNYGSIINIYYMIFIMIFIMWYLLYDLTFIIWYVKLTRFIHLFKILRFKTHYFIIYS